jgi:monoamine oxidase
MTSPILSSDFPTNPDVVVIGAGAAGISATKRLMKKGVSVICVEAHGRVGGRAWTEHESFGMPLDMGCSWVSAWDRNSVARIGEKKGYTFVSHSNAATDLFRDGKRATEKDYAEFAHASKVIQKAMSKKGKKGFDIPARDVVPKDLPWAGAVQAWLGPMDYGVEFDQISTLEDWYGESDQPSAFVAEGLGTVVMSEAQHLPIRLSTPVLEIDWSGQGVRVVTNSGTISAKACIVTVSTGVLIGEGIRFIPALPVERMEALNGVPMGLLMKIPLLFDGARLGLGENNWVTSWIPNELPMRACNFIAWPCGANYLFGNVGGELGWELSREDPHVAVNFALEELMKLVGSDARKHFIKGVRTDWANDPFVRGSYGCVRPGHAGVRGTTLAKPIGDRLFFAGEACDTEYPGFVHGAWDSGRRTANKVTKVLAIEAS